MKKYITKRFLTRYNKDSGDFKMPDYLWYRWYGVNSRFYNKLWGKLDGDNDEYLFEDFCDISFDVKNNNFDWMKQLPQDRTHKLFLFSLGMLSHYLVVNTFWKVVEFLIEVTHTFSRPL